MEDARVTRLLSESEQSLARVLYLHSFSSTLPTGRAEIVTWFPPPLQNQDPDSSESSDSEIFVPSFCANQIFQNVLSRYTRNLKQKYKSAVRPSDDLADRPVAISTPPVVRRVKTVPYQF